MNCRGSYLLFCFVSYLMIGCGDDHSKQGEDSFPIFRLIPSSASGVTFSNNITEGINTNIFMYEYIYNGGGVAVGDVNNDGFVDIYLTSNMESNKLFVNQGGLKFQDITTIAGVSGRPGPWKTGASMIDINGDDRVDIYLCYSGSSQEEMRRNELFINQGNDENGVPIFEEMGEALGLDSRAYSNQAYYFDYDKDGDLDVLLLNHNPQNLPVLNERQTEELMAVDDPIRGIRLYNQQDGKFVDVTASSGINGSPLTYGLGLGISDLNGDRWPDFYVSNDYAIPDYLYLNNQDGTFTNTLRESVGHSSHFSMGNDVADINNDGLVDIITLDMLPEDNRRQKLLLAPDNYDKFEHNVETGFHYQYMRNMLQLNNGNNTFSEVGQMAGISNTDWSWAALAADFDNDGWKDLYITNGYKRDFTNLDFMNYMNSFVEQKGRLEQADVLEIIENMPASDVLNYMYKKSDDINYVKITDEWGLGQVANSNGAAYADLDNDGDLDLVVNNINKEAFVYENLSSGIKGYIQVELNGQGLNTSGIGSLVALHHAGSIQIQEQFPVRGYISSVSPLMHFGVDSLREIDSLVVNWPSGKRSVKYDLETKQRVTFNENETMQSISTLPQGSDILFEEVPSPISFVHEKVTVRDFNRQLLLPYKMSSVGPAMGSGDISGDGIDDIYVGGGLDQAGELFFGRMDGKYQVGESKSFFSDQNAVDTDVLFFDANGDTHIDLYVGSGGYHLFEPNDQRLQDRLYVNDGNGGLIPSKDALPQILTSTGCVVDFDINQDGYADLFVGGKVIPGRYPEAPKSYLLINDGSGKFSDQTSSIAPFLSGLGMVTDASITDLNGDGVPELIVVGEWMGISIYEVKRKLIDVTEKYLDKTYKGLWNTVETGDFNGDGVPDIVAGNVGENLQFKASDEKPAELYYDDFDNNGDIDPVFCYYIGGTSYPDVTRDELRIQMPGFKSKYTSYESFADETIRDMFSDEVLGQAKRLEINELQTSLFLSTSDGRHKKVALPIEAQFSPVYTISVLDYDMDGDKDLLLCGNNSNLKLRFGKADANYGMLFEGDGKGNFYYVNQPRSGLRITGDIRKVIQVQDLLFFARNQDSIVTYQLQNKTSL